MSDEIKHECAVAMVVLRKPSSPTGDFGGTKLSLLMEKQHNRGQDGAGAAILSANPEPGAEPYWIAKSASPTALTDVLGEIGRRFAAGFTGLGDADDPAHPARKNAERIFLGHLRYATFGKNEVAFCHPFIHEASELARTLLLAGNFNLTNARELFEDYSSHGSFPTSKADGYLICEMIAHEMGGRDVALPSFSALRTAPVHPIADAIKKALADADGAWTLCGATGDGWAFATRDPHGIRPGFYYIDDNVVAVASERPAIQAAFDVPPEAVNELPPGQVLIVSPDGAIAFRSLCNRQAADDSLSNCQMPDVEYQDGAQPREHSTSQPAQRSCAFERIYFSRANDADIHRERKALGAALVPQILKAADAPMEDIFFSYIPNSARIAFHGLLEELFANVFISKELKGHKEENAFADYASFAAKTLPRFGEIAVKDAKFRTFIADAAARREFYKHVYDVTYGLVRPGKDTLVVLDDSIVRGNTMKNAILPMLDRLGPKRVVVASSAPPIRYPDCYGIDMSTLDELVSFRALVNLLGCDAKKELAQTLKHPTLERSNTLASLYARFTAEQHCSEIAKLLTPPGMKAEVKVVYQTVENLHKCLRVSINGSSDQTPAHSNTSFGDWYFTGDYPTPGGYRVLAKAISNYLEHKTERSY